jgi:AraC-like DNA-binding protein
VAVDVLSEALASMRTDNPRSVRTNGCAPWRLELPPVVGAGFHVVLYGTCWLIPRADGASGAETGGAESIFPAPPARDPVSQDPNGLDPIALGPGDVVFLRDGRAHVLADHPYSPPGPMGAETFHDGSPIGSVSLGGDGPLTSLLCGNYHLDQARPHPLVRQLPAVVHLPARPDRHPELNAAVALLSAELDNPRMGSDSIVPALIDALLLYILRAWMEQQPDPSVAGWAAALRDPGIAPALAAIHGDPAAPWTVDSLATRAGLSRAAFARRFGALVGEPPLAYLTRWRMTGAAKLLRESEAPLSTVAARTGYGSEFAFAKAFKREFGLPPGGYRRQARAA